MTALGGGDGCLTPHNPECCGNPECWEKYGPLMYPPPLPPRQDPLPADAVLTRSADAARRLSALLPAESGLPVTSYPGLISTITMSTEIFTPAASWDVSDMTMIVNGVAVTIPAKDFHCVQQPDGTYLYTVKYA